MVKEISGAGPDRVFLGKSARSDKPRKVSSGSKGDDAPEAVVGGEVKGLVERVKAAEVYRKERVHQVLEKFQRGELITSETVREAARKILEGGI